MHLIVHAEVHSCPLSQPRAFSDCCCQTIFLGSYALSVGYYDAFYKTAQQVHACGVLQVRVPVLDRKPAREVDFDVQHCQVSIASSMYRLPHVVWPMLFALWSAECTVVASALFHSRHAHSFAAAAATARQLFSSHRAVFCTHCWLICRPRRDIFALAPSCSELLWRGKPTRTLPCLPESLPLADRWHACVAAGAHAREG